MQPTSESTHDEKALCLCLNHDHSCFLLGTTRGFKVFNSDPLRLRFRREWPAGGIICGDLLLKSNIVALVSTAAPSKVVIWDDLRSCSIAELDFPSPVKQVQIRRDILITVLETDVHINRFDNLASLTSLSTCRNPLALCAVSTSAAPVVCCPAPNSGGLTIEWVDVANTGESTTTTRNNSSQSGVSALTDPSTSNSHANGSPISVKSHQNALQCLCVSRDGTMVATASQRGTLVRIFDTDHGGALRELRRGTSKATIISMAFSPDNSMLAVVSDKETIHVFDLTNGAPPPPITESSFTYRLGIGALDQVRSSCRFEVQDNHPQVCFGASKNSLVILSSDGIYSRYTFIMTEPGTRGIVHADIIDFNLIKLASA